MAVGPASVLLWVAAMVSLPFSPSASPRAHAVPPAAKGDLVEAAIKVGTLSRFLAALRAADQVGLLRGPGPFTVFAPEDEAWDKLPAGSTLEDLLKPVNQGRLTALLNHHIAPGTPRADADSVPEEGKLVTVSGGNLELRRSADGAFTVNDARVLRRNLPATNGALCVIDRVLLPPAAP